MKLTTDQINQIDETLVLNKVVYDDIKLELTDHIASDIEEIMTDENVSFETAFKEAFEKWDKQLKIQFNLVIIAPKIFWDKWMVRFKETALYAALLSILISFLVVGYIEIFKSDTILNTVEKIYEYAEFTLIGLLAMGRILMLKSKTKTSLGKMFNTYSTLFILFFSMTLYEGHIFPRHFDSIMGEFFGSFVITFFHVFAALMFRLLYKHFQFERKLSKV